MAEKILEKIHYGDDDYVVHSPLVTQTATSTNANYEVLFSGTADNTTRTEGARKNSNLTFNPSTGTLSATTFSGNVSASKLIIPVNPSTTPTENGEMWITT